MNRLLTIGIPLLAAAVLPFLASNYYLNLFSFIFLYAIVALGLVLLTGVAGLISFGQAAFVGIGAYASAYLSAKYGWGGLATLPVAVLGTVAVALVIGRLTLSMGGHYLSLATLAWGVSIYFALGQSEFLGGFNGLGGVKPLSILGFSLASERPMYYLILLCLVSTMLAVHNLLDSRLGRAIRALRTGSTLPEAFGANTLHLKMAAFAIAAALGAMSGWLYAYLQRFVNPTPFGVHMGVEYLFMAVIGGASSIFGAVLGAGVVTVLKTKLQDVLPALLGQTGNFEVLVFGALMLIVLARAPTGLWPFLSRRIPAWPPMDTGSAKPLELVQTVNEVVPGECLLEARQVSKHFGGLVAVNKVGFRVERGEIVALLGPNGAGKSTTFHLLSGVLLPTSGEVRFNGQRIDGRTPFDIARLGVARTFQHVKLVQGMTALENAAMGCFLRARSGLIASMLRLNRREEAAIRLVAQEQLRRCGLADVANTPAGNLPLGKQRILEVARALCANPSLLLLDEPAAGLRHLEKVELAQLLRTLRDQGITILIVDHDMDFITQLVDRMIVMNFGTKIADGRPEQVRAEPEVQEAYLGSAV
jgi:branched-chain amino acid transport system permease protein